MGEDLVGSGGNLLQNIACHVEKGEVEMFTGAVEEVRRCENWW